MLLHSLGLVYKSMRGMMTNSIDRDVLNVERSKNLWLNKSDFFYLLQKGFTFLVQVL
jgi:hypothetical protein